jgi:hypothetical protein
MALLKRILKMAQLEPLDSRRGIFAGSFSMVVGVTAGGGDETVVILTGEDLGEEMGDMLVDRGTNELEGLVLVLAGRAGPITCRMCINLGE